VYEHELLEVLEYNYVNDTLKNHPTDFKERCSNYVSHTTLLKFSGYTASDKSVASDPYGFLPDEIQKLLRTI
jgi:hypothetical protein